MREYLKCCFKVFKIWVKIDILDTKIKFYKWLVRDLDESSEGWSTKMLYEQTIRFLKEDRDMLVCVADDLIYEMQEKGWIK